MNEIQMRGLSPDHIILKNEDLANVIIKTFQITELSPKENGILVVAETVAGTCEGQIFTLANFQNISPKAKILADKYQMDPHFCEMVIQESDEILGGIPHVLLTLKNQILIANAGIDKSNSGTEGYYSFWPKDPFKTAEILRDKLCQHYKLKNFGIVISDSRVQPIRRGVVGVAIGVAGFDPIIDCRGRKDLFGNELHITTRAMADQLADAAHILMGEADERVPFVYFSDVPVTFTNSPIDRKAMLMPREEDLFFQILVKNINSD